MDVLTEKAFLGTEFLTWLWFRSESGQGSFELEYAGPFEIELDTNAVLEDETDADVRSVTLRGDAPGPSDLMRQGIVEGKKIAKARFRLNWRNVIWTFVIDAGSFAVSGLKLPTAPRGGGDFGEYVNLRLETMEGFSSLMEELYAYYLALRLSESNWQKETGAMSAWMKEQLAA